MQTHRLARGIITLTAMSGTSDGAVLGGIYGALFALALLPSFFNSLHVDWNIGVVGAICVVAFLGFALGYVIGMMCGFALGLASGVTLALITLLLKYRHIPVSRYRSIAILSCVSMVVMSLMLVSALFVSVYKGLGEWITLIGIPTLIAAASFWRIGDRAAKWVEANNSLIVSREEC